MLKGSANQLLAEYATSQVNAGFLVTNTSDQSSQHVECL